MLTFHPGHAASAPVSKFPLNMIPIIETAFWKNEKHSVGDGILNPLMELALAYTASWRC